MNTNSLYFYRMICSQILVNTFSVSSLEINEYKPTFFISNNMNSNMKASVLLFFCFLGMEIYQLLVLGLKSKRSPAPVIPC
jgi:hypothetical protein